MKLREQMILTAGPSITQREIGYVEDAIRNGWNWHHSDYIRKFEEAFARYIGVKHAIATSACTGALHLAMLAYRIGPGDEVILPEITWIATAAAVRYVRAKPVFADVEPDTWVMDPEVMRKRITKKTKAIIPVDIYGNPVNIKAIMEIAREHGLKVIEDAAPAIGAEFEGHKTGSLADAACYSFQGAKMLVTGEGGMFVTNDDAIAERVRFLNDHGRDPDHKFRIREIAYKYKMSNLQAALGLAQIERVEELVAKKRQIFDWYRARLKDVPGLAMNVEAPGCRSIRWMSSIVLPKGCKLGRDEFMAELKKRMIDSRPFFYPLSGTPGFKPMKKSNPVAYDIAARGINLPSGHERTEEDVDYICWHVRDLLGG
ncbi:MAG: DegT/DnrJ/EryC1/StrS family aminotransferase [Candidatus Sumerlaeota bacterium]|nr:DegT/DnrJ/EryC1/StrS family aminotransferase [Candidatus Sumerlaeota bacterium]